MTFANDYRTMPPIERVIEDFLSERVAVDPFAKVKAGTLFRLFEEWARVRGSGCISIRRFGEEMARLGVAKRKSNGVYYVGLRLKP